MKPELLKAISAATEATFGLTVYHLLRPAADRVTSAQAAIQCVDSFCTIFLILYGLDQWRAYRIAKKRSGLSTR